VRQWEEEIQKKLRNSHQLSVFIYHNRKATVDELKQYDVVLTTYGTLGQELRRLENFTTANEGRSVDPKADITLAKSCPLLHPSKAHFYRVILDEAQCIKNHRTQSARACAHVKSTYRWCLTGTPMMNSVVELYSLIHFLRIKPYNDFAAFRKVNSHLSSPPLPQPLWITLISCRCLVRFLESRAKIEGRQ
jgi:SNF2 family DNA or RNA helicase